LVSEHTDLNDPLFKRVSKIFGRATVIVFATEKGDKENNWKWKIGKRKLQDNELGNL
jgi:hypothetical protein